MREMHLTIRETTDAISVQSSPYMVKKQSTSWTEEMQDLREIKRFTSLKRLIISPPAEIGV